jgi:hypothetical protein
MAKSDDKKLEALARKNALKAAGAEHRPKGSKRRQYDPTLQEEEDDSDRRGFFKDMQRREF